MGQASTETLVAGLRICDICKGHDYTRSGTIGFCPHFYGALCISDSRFTRPRLPCPTIPKSVAVLIALLEANYSNDLISYALDKFVDTLETMEFLSEGVDIEGYLRGGKKFWYLTSPTEPNGAEVDRGHVYATVAYGFSGTSVEFEDSKFGRLRHKTYFFRDPRFSLRKTRVYNTSNSDKTSFSTGVSVSGNQLRFKEQMGC